MARPPQIPDNAVQLYALGEPDGLTVKLGKTKGLTTRKKQHETRGPKDVEMKLLFCWWGMTSGESALKEYFKPLRLNGRHEWFTRDDGMSEWLSFMMKQPFVSRDKAGLESTPLVDSQTWLPSRENTLSLKLSEQPSLFNGLPRQSSRKETAGTLAEPFDPWSDLEPDLVGEGDFYSPPALVDAARAVFGGEIDLDPASCREANSRVKAQRFYSVKEDGLRLPWYGNIWVNPPFPWEPWVVKLLSEMQKGRITNLIALCETRVTTAKYFHRLVTKSDAVLKMNGRLQFWGPKSGAPDEGHELYYFGDNVGAFANEFRKFGKVFVPYRFVPLFDETADAIGSYTAAIEAVRDGVRSGDPLPDTGYFAAQSRGES